MLLLDEESRSSLVGGPGPLPLVFGNMRGQGLIRYSPTDACRQKWFPKESYPELLPLPGPSVGAQRRRKSLIFAKVQIRRSSLGGRRKGKAGNRKEADSGRQMIVRLLERGAAAEGAWDRKGAVREVKKVVTRR